MQRQIKVDSLKVKAWLFGVQIMASRGASALLRCITRHSTAQRNLSTSVRALRNVVAERATQVCCLTALVGAIRPSWEAVCWVGELPIGSRRYDYATIELDN